MTGYDVHSTVRPFGGDLYLISLSFQYGPYKTGKVVTFKLSSYIIAYLVTSILLQICGSFPFSLTFA
jgi:hypothetical protein